jgi:hypothetical protein
MFGANVQNLVTGRPGAWDCATLDEMFLLCLIENATNAYVY